VNTRLRGAKSEGSQCHQSSGHRVSRAWDDSSVRNGRLRQLNAVPNYGMRKGLLDDCLAILPYRALTIYCGIRPEGEAWRVEWEDVNWEDGMIKLRPGSSGLVKIFSNRWFDLFSKFIQGRT
jgi:hypothetical protein